MTAVTAEQLAVVERVRALLDAVPRSCIKDTPMIPLHVLTVDAVLAAHDVLVADVEKLRDLVYRLSDALTDEGADWSNEGLAHLRDRAARALPDVEWLQTYRSALPEEPADGT